MRRETLSGPWKVRPHELLGEYQQMLPGHWQELPELRDYNGAVTYSLEFVRPNYDAKERVRLRLNGVFYAAHIKLNGVDLGRHRGYFVPWEKDITEDLADRNLLEIEVHCPQKELKDGEPVIMGLFSGKVSQRPEFNPGGIWLPVELICSGETYLRDIRFQYFTDPSHLLIYTRLRGLQEGTVLSILMHPANFSGYSKKAEFPILQEEERFEWHVRDIELWWTHDLGFPHLYTVEVTITVQGQITDAVSFTYGFRTVQMADDLTFFLNGRRLFLKGSNYFPTDAYLARTTLKNITTDLELAKGAHLNILRINAHVAHPLLYRAADEAGMLLWQDMPLLGEYPQSVLSQARVQVRELIGLLCNHASIAVWCMHQSPRGMAKSDMNLSEKAQFLFNQVFNWTRDVLDAELQRVAEHNDPTRPVIRSSGEFAVLRRPADTHLYYGWDKAYGKRRNLELLKHWLLRRNLTLVSEFGSVSLPNYHHTQAVLGPKTLAEDYPVFLEQLQYWTALNPEAELSEAVEVSQRYQADLNQYYIDNLRFLKYAPTVGLMTYHWQDSEPAISCSVVDYWREPKGSYYALQRALSPQYVFTLLPKDAYAQGELFKITVYAINDAMEGYAAVGAVATLLDAQGNVVATDRYALTLPVDCQVQTAGVFQAELGESGEYILKLDLVMPDRACSNSYKIKVV